MLSPFHRFDNCKQLRAAVASVKGASPPAILEGHKVYHYALYGKLRSARQNLLLLDGLLSSEFPGPGGLDEDLAADANMYLDSLLYFSSGALDILAREVLTYFGIALPPKVYYRTAAAQLAIKYPTDPLLVRLAKPSWKAELATYRNAATHELLLADRLDYHVQLHGGTKTVELRIPLPNDPRKPPGQRRYTRNTDALKYSKTTFKRILSHINCIYGDLAGRITAAGKLPL